MADRERVITEADITRMVRNEMTVPMQLAGLQALLAWENETDPQQKTRANLVAVLWATVEHFRREALVETVGLERFDPSRTYHNEGRLDA